MPTCGHRAGYVAGCRCPACLAAHADYMRTLMAGQRARGLAPGDPRHGRMTGYDNHGCRCPDCRAAAVATRAARRAAAAPVAARTARTATTLLETWTA